MMKKEEMDKILEIERKLAEAKNGMVKEIASDVGNQTMDGVNRIGKNAFTVSFSAIDASDGFILSPDYYSSDSQGHSRDGREEERCCQQEVLSTQSLHSVCAGWGTG